MTHNTQEESSVVVTFKNLPSQHQEEIIEFISQTLQYARRKQEERLKEKQKSEEKNKTQDDSVVEQKNESLQNEVQQNEENKEPKVIKDRQVEIYYGFILDKFGGEKLSQRETPLYERLMDVALPLRDEAGVRKCFNCGRPDHNISDCTEKKDVKRIIQNKQLFFEWQRSRGRLVDESAELRYFGKLGSDDKKKENGKKENDGKHKGESPPRRERQKRHRERSRTPERRPHKRRHRERERSPVRNHRYRERSRDRYEERGREKFESRRNDDRYYDDRYYEDRYYEDRYYDDRYYDDRYFEDRQYEYRREERRRERSL